MDVFVADVNPIRHSTPEALQVDQFEPGSMGPKVAAASEFVIETGGMAGIGRLEDAVAILAGDAGIHSGLCRCCRASV